MKSPNRKKAVISFYLTVVTLIALVLSSYAWMAYSSTPTVGNLAFSLVTANALEIAPDVDGAPGEWSSILDLSNPSGKTKVEETTTSSEEETSEEEDDDINYLSPVTFSAKDFCFYVAKTGIDGRPRLDDLLCLADLNGDISADTPVAADSGVTLGDFVYIETFWLRTEATDCMVSLAESKLTTDNEKTDEKNPEKDAENANKIGDGTFMIGEPEWDEKTESHYYTGRGAENALRVGFLIEPVEEDGDRIFVIYEPNADSNGKTVYTDSIDGADYTYEGKYKIIRQHRNKAEEVYPPDKDKVLYTPGAFYNELIGSDGEIIYDEYGNAEKDETYLDLFWLKAGEENARRVTVIIWLEGNDINCNSSISNGRVFSNIQLTAREYHPGEIWTE